MLGADIYSSSNLMKHIFPSSDLDLRKSRHRVVR